MSQAVRVRYSAGGWLGLVRGRCLVALPVDASEETAAVAWDLLAGAPGVEQLLATVLSGRLDLTGLPSFAIVSFREGASVHAILRGEVSLRMTTTAGDQTELTGTGVATWNERVFRDIGSFELLVDDAVSDVENLPLESGAVRLGSLHADLGTTSPAPDEADDAEARPAPVPEPRHASASGPDAVAAAAVEVQPDLPAESEASPADELEAEPEAETAPASEAEAGAEEAPEAEVEADAVPETEADDEDEEKGDEGAQEDQTDHEETEPEPESESEPTGDDVTDQDATIAPDAQSDPAAPETPAQAADAGAEDDAAGRAEDVDDQTIAGPVTSTPSGTPADASTDASTNIPPGPESVTAQPARPGGSVPGPQELIDSVPWLAAARKAVPPQVPESTEGTEATGEQMVEVPADLNMTVAPSPSLEDEADPADGPPQAQGSEPTNAEDADDADTVLSPSTPGAAPTPAPPAPPAGPPSGSSVPGSPALDAEDHDGETVMKSDLDPADLEAGAPAPAPVPPPTTGPVVLARQCSDGHANPPTSAKCGICGQSLSGEAQQMRRPSLGRIRMSTGEVVELDRPAVVGRQPQAHRVGSGTMPRMVQVRSPNGDISRSHCEVVLEGWHVQLRDLKATNGTVLIREGQPPRRLGQGESLMVLDGDIADLGDGVSLRFEGLL